MKVVALILARGGSRGIPRKNIKLLVGRPLIDWNITAAKDSGVFDEIWVSTDCDEIAKVAKECGALVFRRSKETASHTASSESGMLEFTEAHPEFDVISLVQATSPLTMPSHFQEAFALLTDVGADSLVTAVIQHRFLWKVNDDGSAMAKNYDPINRPLRQDWNGELIENGAFYFTTKATLDKYKCRLGGKISCYEMPEHTFTELDSLTDWAVMEGLARQYGYQKMGKTGPVSATAASAIFEISPGRFVGGEYPPFVIARGGTNHNGKLPIAKALIDVASKCGADAVEFQKREVDRILIASDLKKPFTSDNSFGDTFESHKKSLELDVAAWREMKARADEVGVIFTATGYDEQSVDFLDSLGVPFFMISSEELTNFPLLLHTAKKHKPVVLCTGMADIPTIKAAVNIVQNQEPRIVLLHNTSTFPAEYEDLHLRCIETYYQEFPQCVIGYSGHERGVAVTSAVTAKGAKIIQRPFTLDRTMKGAEHAASLEEKGLEVVVRDARNMHLSLVVSILSATLKSNKRNCKGTNIKEIRAAEESIFATQTKSAVSKQAIAAGTVFTEAMLTTKGPGTGVSPMKIKTGVGGLLGKKATKDIPADTLLQESDVAW